MQKHEINDYSLLLGIVEEIDYFEGAFKKNNKVSRTTFFVKDGIESKRGYYLGIIDTLTHFGPKKSMEFIFKRIYQGDGISCKPPATY